jgi:membrane protease YdiL (CAAX protease family)
MDDDGSLMASTGTTGEASRRFRSFITWTPREMLIGIGCVVLLVFIASSAIVLPVQESYGEESPETYFSSAIATILWQIGFVLAAYFVVRRTGAGWPNLGFRQAFFVAHDLYDRIRRTLPLPKLAVAVVTGYAMSFGVVYLYGIIITVTGADFLEPSEQLPDSLFDNSLVVAVTGLAVVIGAPIAEEVLFRGFMFGGLRRYLSFWPAALISGFIFAAPHFNVGLLIPFTGVGAVLAFTYERSGTLWANILVHMLFNLTSFSLLVFFPELR